MSCTGAPAATLSGARGGPRIPLRLLTFELACAAPICSEDRAAAEDDDVVDDVEAGVAAGSDEDEAAEAPAAKSKAARKPRAAGAGSAKGKGKAAGAAAAAAGGGPLGGSPATANTIFNALLTGRGVEALAQSVVDRLANPSTRHGAKIDLLNTLLRCCG